jgi:hypothetical protein
MNDVARTIDRRRIRGRLAIQLTIVDHEPIFLTVLLRDEKCGRRVGRITLLDETGFDELLHRSRSYFRFAGVRGKWLYSMIRATGTTPGLRVRTIGTNLTVILVPPRVFTSSGSQM